MPVGFHKGNKKFHDDKVRVWGKLERGYIEELENVINKWIKGKRSSCFHDYLTKGCVTRGR